MSPAAARGLWPGGGTVWRGHPGAGPPCGEDCPPPIRHTGACRRFGGGPPGAHRGPTACTTTCYIKSYGPRTAPPTPLRDLLRSAVLVHSLLVEGSK